MVHSWCSTKTLDQFNHQVSTKFLKDHFNLLFLGRRNFPMRTSWSNCWCLKMPQWKISRHKSLSSHYSPWSFTRYFTITHNSNPKGKKQCNVVTLCSRKTLELRDRLDEKICHHYASPMSKLAPTQSPRPAAPKPFMDILVTPNQPTLSSVLNA